ncbi:Toprim domain-containing protein [Gillisia sp. Hel_I_86]|uniref:toprim domain-containing protein n=1 Tax=Gillisia sp. Hel_I_86 TaxID=1249981 RepID=UPI0011996B36|nr:toprim domain-containing protein [Gillisia sp. Hel_I_86]TVZ26058.1 Toprim domain-containing protein [Gillisia sp. Hel_I_86]
MKEKRLTCERARSICIVETLAKLGHFPNRTTEKEAWFLSPLRSETQASFKVSLKLNRWYDFGMGKGGNVIDLVCLISNCSVGEALRYLSHDKPIFSFQQPSNILDSNFDKNTILEVRTISQGFLKKYLYARGISLQIAQKYCKEVWYTCKGKKYHALGLQNIESGWELRNPYSKTSTSPKTYTYLKDHSDRLILVEGMFDLLSLAELFPNELENSDVIILNSLSFLEQVSLLFKKYNRVELYLDNDQSGNNYSEELIQKYKNIIDKSNLFNGYKDLNEKLISIKKKRSSMKKYN